MSEPFNKVEMMVLAKLSYYKAPGIYDSTGNAIAPCTLHEMLKTYKSDLVQTFDSKTVSDLMAKVENKNYTVVKAVDNTYSSGFEAIAIEGPDSKTVTVAARGSEGIEDGGISNIEDLVQDWVFADVVGLGFQSESQQHKDMNSFMKDLDKYDSIYLTGHSLGGNLAVNGAVCFEDPDKIKGVYTYNAPGQNASYMATHALGILRVQDKITNYQTEGDVVSDINTPIGDVVVVKSSGKGNAHSLSDFSRKGSDFIKSKKNVLHTYASNFIDRFTAKTSIFTAAVLQSVFPFSSLEIFDNGRTYSWLNNQYQNAVNVVTGNNDAIFVNTDGLIGEAKKMRSYQQEYEVIIQKITNLIVMLQQEHVWDTTATTTFINNYLELKSVFDKFSQIMTEYATIMENVSERMRSTDNTLASKFNDLSM